MRNQILLQNWLYKGSINSNPVCELLQDEERSDICTALNARRAVQKENISQDQDQEPVLEEDYVSK